MLLLSCTFSFSFHVTQSHDTGAQGSKFLGFRISGTPKNGDGNPNLDVGFPTGNPACLGLSG